MNEHVPQTPEQEPKPLDAGQALATEFGPPPAELEKPIQWAANEQEELSAAAVTAMPEDDPVKAKRIRQRAISRFVVTGLATAMLMPMLSGSAEAGGWGRRGQRRSGAIVSILGGIGERVFAEKQYEHRQQAENLDFQLRMLQEEGETLLQRMHDIGERQDRLEQELSFEKRQERQEQLKYELHRLELARESLRERAIQIDRQINRLGPAFQDEVHAARKARLFEEISAIAGSRDDAVRIREDNRAYIHKEIAEDQKWLADAENKLGALKMRGDGDSVKAIELQQQIGSLRNNIRDLEERLETRYR